MCLRHILPFSHLPSSQLNQFKHKGKLFLNSTFNLLPPLSSIKGEGEGDISRGRGRYLFIESGPFILIWGVFIGDGL